MSEYIEHGKKGMKWGYTNGVKNGKKTAVDEVAGLLAKRAATRTTTSQIRQDFAKADVKIKDDARVFVDINGKSVEIKNGGGGFYANGTPIAEYTKKEMDYAKELKDAINAIKTSKNGTGPSLVKKNFDPLVLKAGEAFLKLITNRQNAVLAEQAAKNREKNPISEKVQNKRDKDQREGKFTKDLNKVWRDSSNIIYDQKVLGLAQRRNRN